MDKILRIRSSAHKSLYLVEGIDRNNREAFYYLQTDIIKESIFRREIRKGQQDIRKWGKIIFSGFGRPNDFIISLLQEEYGYILETEYGSAKG